MYLIISPKPTRVVLNSSKDSKIISNAFKEISRTDPNAYIEFNDTYEEERFIVCESGDIGCIHEDIKEYGRITDLHLEYDSACEELRGMKDFYDSTSAKVFRLRIKEV